MSGSPLLPLTPVKQYSRSRRREEHLLPPPQELCVPVCTSIVTTGLCKTMLKKQEEVLVSTSQEFCVHKCTHMLCCMCDLPVHTHVCTVIEELVFTFYMKNRKLKGDSLYPTS